MNIKLDDNVLMDMVFRCLCRVLKNRKIYHRFRCFIGFGGRSKKPNEYNFTTNIYSNLKSLQDYIAMGVNMDNLFCFATCKDDIFKKLKEVIGNNDCITNENCYNASKVQMRIMQYLNTLLHSCVEKTVNDFSEIEHIGQETFDMVCKKIYGDDFVDETEKSIPEDMKKMIDAQREYSNRMGMSTDPRLLHYDSNFITFLKDRGVIDTETEGWSRRRPIRMTPVTEDQVLDEEGDFNDWEVETFFGDDLWLDE